MTDFRKYTFTGNSKGLTNGVAANQKVFAFRPKAANNDANPPAFSFNDQNETIVGTPEDLDNYDYVMMKLGLKDDENQFQNTLDYTASKANNVENAYLKKKFLLVRKANFEIVEFILKTLHNLYWLNFLSLGDNTARLSGIDIHEALELINKPVRGLMIVLYTQIEQKHPNELSGAALKHMIEMDKLNTKHDFEVAQTAVKSEKKKKNKK